MTVLIYSDIKKAELKKVHIIFGTHNFALLCSITEFITPCRSGLFSTLDSGFARMF